jgi:hypothetical protein
MRGSHAEALGTADDPEYGEVTGAFIRAAQDERQAAADALLNGAPSGRSHARTRVSRFRRLIRREAPAAVSQLLAGPVTASQLLVPADSDEPGEFTGIVSTYEAEAEPLGEEAFARPETGEPREDEAAGRIVAERADLARMYVPPEIAAVPWGLWDTPASREPMRYVPDLHADLTDLAVFREALRSRTRSGASQCLCGAQVTGQTWGERMARVAIHLLSPLERAALAFAAWPRAADAAASGTEAAPGTPEPPEIATAMEACDAVNPVPAAMAGEDVTP